MILLAAEMAFAVRLVHMQHGVHEAAAEREAAIRVYNFGASCHEDGTVVHTLISPDHQVH